MNVCNECENQITCENTNDYNLILTQKGYKLRLYHENQKRLKEYEILLNEILNGEYTIPVNVYGNIQQVPRQNVFGVLIRKPEHVMYGWNYQRLERQSKVLMECIRVLAAREFELRPE